MKTLGVIALLFLGALLSGCLWDDGVESNTPGCDGDGGIGGCLGKSFIRDVAVTPTRDCLAVKANNCNGGVLRVDNNCADALNFEGFSVPAGSWTFVEIVEAPATIGMFAIELKGNVACLVPESGASLSASASLGGEELIISYYKENVCGEARLCSQAKLD